MAFSGALTLTDLNDFITPAQACIKPVEQKNPPPASEKKERDAGAASTEIMIDSSGVYYEVSMEDSTHVTASSSSTNERLPQAQISLNDCLACSGCITSAESVLITMQSHVEVMQFLEGNSKLGAEERKVAVVSIAPQSLASFAASLSSRNGKSPNDDDKDKTITITPRQVLGRLRAFLKDVLGFDHVFDTTYARELALREHVKEFVERCEGEKRGEQERLPMLASACPGWICYAEKAHAEMLPFIAQTKSPQQVMGTLVKKWLGPKWGKRPDGVYHVTVMPCYDKKLEASRKDFYDEIYSTRDVDCVITTGELETMMREKGWDLGAQVKGEMGDGRDWSERLLPELVDHKGTSSGSYLHRIMEHMMRGRGEERKMEVKMIRNTDYEEYTITEGEQVLFKGAKCYGFRNLQNIVRKVGKEQGVGTSRGAAGRMGRTAIRRKTETEKKYDYVEVMACPGGCVNGGGQLKPLEGEDGDREGRWGNREWTGLVEAAYWQGGEGGEESEETAEVEINTELELRTWYHAVESEVVGLAVKW